MTWPYTDLLSFCTTGIPMFKLTNVVNTIICCASIVVDIAWVQLTLQNCAKLQNLLVQIAQKRINSVRGLYDKKQRLIVLFTSDVMKKSIFKRLVYTPPDLSTRFTCKVNLSNTKNPAWFIILASLLDSWMQRVNWLPPRTIVCFIKLYFGALQLSTVSPTEWLERLWINLVKLRWCRWMTGLFCSGRICFPRLIYCDRTWWLFLGVHKRLLTRCKICYTFGLSSYFSAKSIRLCLKSHMNVPLKLSYLWITSLLLLFIYLRDYKFIVWFKLWIY